jgi:spore coat polysaccharide biosynthesis predicted glycosyltransferase SpsG/CMP-N-acetylneuraminic acid synthetase
MKVIILIPARGGSQGVPRKNVRLLEGSPLICHVLKTIKSLTGNIFPFVMTDDDEIEFISKKQGIEVIREAKTTGKATLDDVTIRFLDSLPFQPNDEDILITIQPTCPFVKAETILKCIGKIEMTKGSVLTVKDDRHLSWTIDENGNPKKKYKERVNRQQLPPDYRESGAIIGSMIGNIRRNKTRIVEPIGLVEVDREEGIDIDDFYDWSIAEYIATRKKIVIRTDASIDMGMGHAYRSLALAQELARHEVVFYTDPKKPLGSDFLCNYPFPLIQGNENEFAQYLESQKPDVVFVDMLDTSSEFMTKIKSTGCKLVTFEDLGSGAKCADLLISDLYPNDQIESPKQFSGVENAILAPSFDTTPPKSSISDKVKNILILFGGTDPSNLTIKALEALKFIGFKGQVTVIQGLGRKDRIINLNDYGLNGELLTNVTYIPKYMYEADIALSSAGRTITELMSLGIPTICLCQNEKELTHTHATEEYGVINLGLGNLVNLEVLGKRINSLIESPNLRSELNKKAIFKSRNRKNSQIVKNIWSKLF